MDLDELKKSWQQSNQKMDIPNKNILDLIQRAPDGPIAQLKRRFKKGLLLIPFITVFALFEFKGSSLSGTYFKGYLISFCVCIIIYFYINYRMISKLEDSQDSVKEHLERQVRFLKKGLRIRLLFMRSMFVIYMILLEALIYFRPEGGLYQWQQQPLWVRLGVYAAVFVLGFTITKVATGIRYKKQIQKLEELVQQLD